MKILPITDPTFVPYGKVLPGYDTAELLAAMKRIPMPEKGVAYEPGIDSLEACAVFSKLRDNAYGGMPIELGMCWGYNTKLNCLEYHRDSELNIAQTDLVLLLARMEEIENGVLDTSKVKAFRVPQGVVVEIYATTLHYAPCHLDPQNGFRMAVVLPKGTNTELPDTKLCNNEDRLLFARNKWLLAHPDSEEAAKNAYIGLTGENIDIAGLI